jgi:D-tagatose-1,6-bisphosphate aldolase subunit GatZ/KbaZ
MKLLLDEQGHMTPNLHSQMTTAPQALSRIVQENREGRATGIYSICSANRFVLEAGMLQALRDDSVLLIESTSNQVNQFGGYTDQTPADFVDFVHHVANDVNFPFDRLLLGGDHLGPHVWRKEPSAVAMHKAADLIRDSVHAGYTKIHLDASMRLADDAGDPHQPPPDELVSARAADLCKVAEEAHRQMPSGSPAPLYVIGTEVPIPGGEQVDSQSPAPTRLEDLEHTLKIAKEAFAARGLQSAWSRVVAVVVQPGVEFADATVFPYDRKKTQVLSGYAAEHWQGVYEAHSTDYQAPLALREMVQDHFAILKVGPWLTFSFREAVFALAAIEEEWLSSRKDVSLSGVREVLERAMLANPVYWNGYYRGDEAQLRLARKYSYSDRARYYWPQPEVAAAVQQLLHNLSGFPAPLALISQYMPAQAQRISAGMLSPNPRDMIRSKILDVLDHYALACGLQHA